MPPDPHATAGLVGELGLPALNGVIVRYDEIFLKRSLRAHFLDLLDRNLHSAIRPFGALKIRRPHGRFVIQVHEPKDALPPPPPLPRARELSSAVSRVFGVASVSPAYILEPGLDQIMAKVPQLVGAWLQARPAATFGVRVKRVDKRFPLDSMALGRELGARILADHPTLGVDL